MNSKRETFTPGYETKGINAPYYLTIMSSLKSSSGFTESNVVCAVIETICPFSVL